MIQYVYVPDVPESDPKKQSEKRTYICKSCHTVIMARQIPPSQGCPTAVKQHQWYSQGLIGTKPKVFVCKICGLRVSSSMSASMGTGGIGTCEGGKNHLY
ncbi:MAG: hypothetical protein HUK25_05135 [Treponema sp.]|nr:hypothetical protein [Treponema sp.]